MKYWPLIVAKLPANAMALYPFMLFKAKHLMADAVIVNHERIHFKQQQELLILPFYLLYLSNYLVNRFRFKDHHTAYLHICFEKEAYMHDHDLLYLKRRKSYSWLHFITRRTIE